MIRDHKGGITQGHISSGMNVLCNLKRIVKYKVVEVDAVDVLRC